MSEIIRIADEGVLFGSSISVTVIERGPSFRGITLIFPINLSLEFSFHKFLPRTD